MCGIAGIVSRNKNVNILENIYQASHSIKHRGMDDEGYVLFNEQQTLCAGGDQTSERSWNYPNWFQPSVHIRQANDAYQIALAHRRLSIVDLSPNGHQPMCSDDKNYWITFNGEIYNYKEIKRELEAKGYTFKTQTDTEILLFAYIEWGEQLHSKLNGMWAFVIYDKNKQTLFGSRDRFGVKPLYYWCDPLQFIFASEIKALLTYPGINRTINPESAFDYLATGFSEKGAESFFKGIFELPPSHFFIFDTRSFQLTIKKYYELKIVNVWEKFNSEKYNSYTHDIRISMLNSIESRLSSEVSMGITLSGGLDSSSILSLTGKLYKEKKFYPINNNLQLFTSSFNESSRDETHWAEIAFNQNKEFTTWNKDYPSGENIAGNIENLIQTQDIPFYSLSVYSHFELMKKVKEKGIKAVLDGQGGDELMAGYNIHFSIYLKELIKNKAFNEIGHNLSFNKTNSFSIKSSDLSFLGKNAFNGFSQNKLIKLYQFQLLNKFHFTTDFAKAYPEKIKEQFTRYDKSLNDFLKEQFTGPDLKTLLRVADRNSMASGIENRTPFADDIDLIEKIFSIPSVYKIRNNRSKALLRDSMNGILPDKIKNRMDKIGFATPEYKWFKLNETYFLDHFNDSDEFIDYTKIKKHWKSYDSMLKSNISRLWRITNFRLWRKTFNL